MRGWSWFKFSDLGQIQGKTLKVYTGVAKYLELKTRMFWLLIRTFVEVTGENLVEVLLVPYLFEILELFFHAPLVE